MEVKTRFSTKNIKLFGLGSCRHNLRQAVGQSFSAKNETNNDLSGEMWLDFEFSVACGRKETVK